MAAIDGVQVEAIMALEGNHEEAALQDTLRMNAVDGAVDEATKIALKASKGDRGYFCDICKISCKYDEDKIKEHMEGNKHKKNNASQLKLLELNQKYDCFEQDPKTGTLHCMICNLRATSPQLLEGHFNGKLHKKMVMDAAENSNSQTDMKQPLASAKVVTTGTTSGLETTVEAVTEAAAAAAGSAAVMAGVAAAAERITSNSSAAVAPKGDGSLLYWCKICKMHGNVPPAIIDTHMEGAKHKKKEAGYYLLQKLKQQEDCIGEDPKSGYLICNVCCIEISTAQQLATHLAGTKHKNKVKSVAAQLAETAELEEGEIAAEVYWCDVCKLSGPATDTAVAHHQQGSKHLKKVAQMQLLEKLLITEDCFDYNETTGMLKCTVCNIEHNSPQLLETHLESDKHKARMDGRPIEGKSFKRNYKDYDDPYQTDAKRMTPNPKDRRNDERSVNVLSYNSEERRNHNRSRDPSNNKRPITQDNIRNFSAPPHSEIKDMGKLMNKWAFAYYRNNS